jgi:hypothetical protein
VTLIRQAADREHRNVVRLRGVAGEYGDARVYGFNQVA